MMAYVVICGFFWLLSCAFSKSKNIYMVFVVVMWILFAFSYRTADYYIYLRRFNSNYGEHLEPLFKLYIKLLKFFHLNIKGFIFLTGTFFIVSLIYLTKKQTKCVGFVLALYFVYPFCMDISQLRSALSFIPIMLGFKYLLSDETKDEFKYILCVIISTGIHYSGLCFIILLLCKKIDLKKMLLLTFIGLYFALKMENIREFAIYFAERIGADSKLRTVFGNLVMNDPHTVLGTQKMSVVTFLIIVIFLLLIKIYVRDNQDYIKLVDLVIRINIGLLIFVPLYRYAVDLFRIQRMCLIFAYIVFAKFFENSSEELRKYSCSAILKKGIFLVLPVLSFIMNVYPNLMDGVVYSIFRYNLLFGGV